MIRDFSVGSRSEIRPDKNIVEPNYRCLFTLIFQPNKQWVSRKMENEKLDDGTKISFCSRLSDMSDCYCSQRAHIKRNKWHLHKLILLCIYCFNWRDQCKSDGAKRVEKRVNSKKFIGAGAEVVTDWEWKQANLPLLLPI